VKGGGWKDEGGFFVGGGERTKKEVGKRKARGEGVVADYTEEV